MRTTANLLTTDIPSAILLRADALRGICTGARCDDGEQEKHPARVLELTYN
jgi:hypothetical protein